jgi:hypothetical protein
MKILISTIERGHDVLEKEANSWWSGIASMEVKLGYPAAELEKLFWLASDFNTETEESNLKSYKEIEVYIAVIRHGKLYPEKITSYKSGRRYFVTKRDYDILSNRGTDEEIKSKGKV